jgi:alkylated DNA repair dioxygenase AlkB
MPVSARQSELFEAEKSLPDGFVYRADFITHDEEAMLLAAIRALPLQEARYKQYTARRRIVSFGSEYDFATNEMMPAPALPAFLLPLRQRVADWLGMRAHDFAHALVTEYRTGTPLGWHRDTPNFQVVAGVSLLGPCRMRFRPYPPAKASRDTCELTLEPRSAYVMRGEARWRWQHRVMPTTTLRYSITFRTLGQQ